MGCRRWSGTSDCSAGVFPCASRAAKSMASEKTINERPQVLKDFLEASYRGWRDVMENPKAALEIFKKRVPEIDLALIEPNMMLGLELMRTDRYAQNGIGWMDRAKMCRTVELINTYMASPIARSYTGPRTSRCRAKRSGRRLGRT